MKISWSAGCNADATHPFNFRGAEHVTAPKSGEQKLHLLIASCTVRGSARFLLEPLDGQSGAFRHTVVGRFARLVNQKLKRLDM
jgi:hypothetical protein